MINLNSPSFGKLIVNGISKTDKGFSYPERDTLDGDLMTKKLALKLLEEHANNKEIKYLEKQGFDLNVGVYVTNNIKPGVINQSMNTPKVQQIPRLADRKTGEKIPCLILGAGTSIDYSGDKEETIHKIETERLDESIKTSAQIVKMILKRGKKHD